MSDEASNLNLASPTQVTESCSGIQMCWNKQLNVKHPSSCASMSVSTQQFLPANYFMISKNFAWDAQVILDEQKLKNWWLTSKSVPARVAPLRLQFFNLAFFKVATLRLIPVIWLPSISTPFRLAPRVKIFWDLLSLKIFVVTHLQENHRKT